MNNTPPVTVTPVTIEPAVKRTLLFCINTEVAEGGLTRAIAEAVAWLNSLPVQQPAPKPEVVDNNGKQG